MSGGVLILRPKPGASETAARAAKLGLKAMVAPLFIVKPVPWDAPDPARFDAVLMTSANAARHGGDRLARFVSLPCYAVGDGTAAAAKEAGFATIRNGPGDGQALIDLAGKDGALSLFHPCGRDHIALDTAKVSVTRRIVYVADGVDRLPAIAVAALGEGAVTLLHSPRAGALFAELVDQLGTQRATISLVAISDAASRAAGEGWGSKAVASRPRDEALLELAAKLCQTVRRRDGNQQ